MFELIEGEVPLLSPGDGLGEKFPVMKSQVLPVTPFKPVKQRQKKSIILHTLLQNVSHLNKTDVPHTQNLYFHLKDS